MLRTSAFLILGLMLSGCQSLCARYYPSTVGSGTSINISEELVSECDNLDPLVIEREDPEPFLTVLEAHKSVVATYTRCRAAKRDLNKIVRKLANKEIK